MLFGGKAFFLCNKISKNFNILEDRQRNRPKSQPEPLATELLIKKRLTKFNKIFASGIKNFPEFSVPGFYISNTVYT